MVMPYLLPFARLLVGAAELKNVRYILNKAFYRWNQAGLSTWGAANRQVTNAWIPKKQCLKLPNQQNPYRKV